MIAHSPSPRRIPNTATRIVVQRTVWRLLRMIPIFLGLYTVVVGILIALPHIDSPIYVQARHALTLIGIPQPWAMFTIANLFGASGVFLVTVFVLRAGGSARIWALRSWACLVISLVYTGYVSLTLLAQPLNGSATVTALFLWGMTLWTSLTTTVLRSDVALGDSSGWIAALIGALGLGSFVPTIVGHYLKRQDRRDDEDQREVDKVRELLETELRQLRETLTTAQADRDRYYQASVLHEMRAQALADDLARVRKERDAANAKLEKSLEQLGRITERLIGLRHERDVSQHHSPTDRGSVNAD